MLVVTGANGFIGSALVWKLNQEGIDNILCVDSVSTDDRSELLSPLKYKNFMGHFDLFDFLKGPFASQVRGVFHIGACSDTTETDESFLNENNTEYTNSLFQECTRLNIPYIYASSAAVYGNGANGFDDKKEPEEFLPLNLYGKSKQNSDIWVTSQGLTPPRWYGLRFFNVYGPNEYHKGSMSSLVYKAFHQIKETGKLKLFKSYNPDYEDGKQVRDFVYVKDVINWTWQLYKNSHVKSGIYNMGYGRARTWLDLASAVFSAMDKPMEIDWIEMPDELKGQYQYFTEAKMKKIFEQGLKNPEWSLEEGIDDYIKNYLEGSNAYLQ